MFQNDDFMYNNMGDGDHYGIKNKNKRRRPQNFAITNDWDLKDSPLFKQGCPQFDQVKIAPFSRYIVQLQPYTKIPNTGTINSPQNYRQRQDEVNKQEIRELMKINQKNKGIAKTDENKITYWCSKIGFKIGK